LHLKLGALHLHQYLCSVHLWWLEKLVRLWEARPNVASRGLSSEWHLPLSILLHFLEFTFNNNSIIDHVLEINIISVEQLELNIIIQSFQEHVLLLFISVEVFGGVSGQLNEWVEVLIDRHAALPQVSEFPLLQLHGAAGYIVVTEMSLELVPCDGVDICMGVTVRLPPICCHTKELVRGKKNLLMIRALGDRELLLNSNKPIFGLHGVLDLWEGGGASSQELRQMRLVWWWRWRCLLLVSLLVGLYIIEGMQHGLHKLILGGDQLFEVDIVVGVVIVVAGLAIALAIPCVHHMMVW
jgi:hypothetical protein